MFQIVLSFSPFPILLHAIRVTGTYENDLNKLLCLPFLFMCLAAIEGAISFILVYYAQCLAFISIAMHVYVKIFVYIVFHLVF